VAGLCDRAGPSFPDADDAFTLRTARTVGLTTLVANPIVACATSAVESRTLACVCIGDVMVPLRLKPAG